MTNREKITVETLKTVDEMLEVFERGMLEVSGFLKKEDVWDDEFDKIYHQIILVGYIAVDLRDILKEQRYDVLG